MKILDKAKALGRELTARRTEKKKLRGPTGLQFAIADRIQLLNPDAWDRAAARVGFFMSRKYFAALEAALPENISPRYALIFDDATDGAPPTPLAAVYLQIAKIGVREVRPIKAGAASSHPAKKWLAPTTEKLVDRAEQQVLVCGNLLVYGQHGVAFAEGADADVVWHGVAEILFRVRQMEKLLGKTHFVMIKDLHDEHIKNAKKLEKLSYRYVETEPNMLLTLDPAWKSHDDYLASLASKYRSSARNSVFKPIDEAGCTVESLDDIEPVAARIHALYRDVQINASFRPFALPVAYFATLQRAAGAKARCTVIKREGQLLGFMFSVADGDTSIAYHIGFDRAATATLPIYLRLLHAAIGDAIALGCKRVSFGRTALDPKAALGAKPQTFGVLLRHRQPVINKVIKHLLLGIEHEDAPERNPFKKAV